MDKNKIVGIVSLISAAFLWGLWGVFARLLGLGFGVFYQLFVRSLILLICFLAYVILTRSWKKVERGDWKWFLIISASGLLSGAGSFVVFNHLAIGTVLFYSYASSTVGGYILGRLFFGEQMTKTKIMSLAACLSGLLLLFYSTIERSNLGYIILTILVGFAFIGWSVFSKKVTTKYPLAQVLLIDNFNFVVSCFILALIFREPIIWPSFSLLWLYVFLFSLLVLAASTLHFYGFKLLEAQIASLIILLEVVFGVFFGWLFYKEVLTIYSLIGGFLILFGAVLPNLFISNNSNDNKIQKI